MSKRKSEKMLVVWLFAIIVVVAVGSANAQVDYVLMVQQTPADGGSVTPDIGVHNVSANGDVKVTATPKPGYQFAYWLGDVSEPTANSTVVAVNSPKIVVAVFQRSEYELPFEASAGSDGGSGGGGGLTRNSQYVGGGGGISPASGSGSYSYPSYHTVSHISIPPTDKPVSDDEPPVPGGNDVPEPATMLLLGIGSILALKRKKINK